MSVSEFRLEHPAAWALLVLAAVAGFLSIVILFVRRERLASIYREHLGSDIPRERLLLASIGFYTMFAVIRVITHAIHSGRGPFHDVASKSGVHIHHMVWGIGLLLIVGYCWLWQVSLRFRPLGRLLAFAYGVGSALTLDEFALWLNLRDVYWQREGRESIDAVLLFSALLSMGIFGGRFVHAISREALHAFRIRRA